MTTKTDPSTGGNERRVRVRLYVAGDGPNSATAVTTLQALLTQQSASHIDLEIIDVLKTPEQAVWEGVLVTPMLVKVEPPPERRILGNLSDRATLLAVLGLDWARP